jgi:hypothetical protein
MGYSSDAYAAMMARLACAADFRQTQYLLDLAAKDPVALKKALGKMPRDQIYLPNGDIHDRPVHPLELGRLESDLADMTLISSQPGKAKKQYSKAA